MKNLLRKVGERVHELCATIGDGRQRALRLHYQIDSARRQEFIDYASALKGWLEDVPPDDRAYYRSGSERTTRKVYGFLEAREPLKDLLVERTHIGLSARFLNCSFWGNDDVSPEPETQLQPHTAGQLDAGSFRRMADIERVVQREMGTAANDFLCDVGGSSEPACHFKFIRRVDILVSSIGCLSWRGNLPEKDPGIRGRRQKTALFMDVLEHYWNGRSMGPGDADTDTERDRLMQLLGEPSDLKKWLAASLWGNIRNQTTYEAFPMTRWVEFVQIGERHMDAL